MSPEYAIKVFGIPITVFISAIIFIVFISLVLFFLIKEGKKYFNNQDK